MPEPVEEVKEPVEQPVPEKEPEPEKPVVKTVYNGPIDSFIRKLSDEEKVEFAHVFFERSENRLSNIPEYAVGGNNSRFFSAVFIYYPHVRKLVSDGLMQKLYEEINS